MTVMQKLRGGAGPRARRAGAAARGSARGLRALEEGSGQLRALPAPRGRLSRAWGPRSGGQRAGTARQRSPPLVADVGSPECAFIIDEPPSPPEGEARKKGEEGAQAGGRGEEEGPGTRYKGGGGRRRKRTPARQPPCPRLRDRSRPPRSWRLAKPGAGAQARGLNPFRPAAAWRRRRRGLGPGTCQLGRGWAATRALRRWPRAAGEVTRSMAEAARAKRPPGSPPGGSQSRQAGGEGRAAG